MKPTIRHRLPDITQSEEEEEEEEECPVSHQYPSRDAKCPAFLRYHPFLSETEFRARRKTNAPRIVFKLGGRKQNCTKGAITTAPDANDVGLQVLKAVDHDHPPSLEEVEALRRCIRLKRAAENESVASPAQIIQPRWEDDIEKDAKSLESVTGLVEQKTERSGEDFLTQPGLLMDCSADYDDGDDDDDEFCGQSHFLLP
ncbi:hypothetical protein ANN_14564 [Periplaneta americana]|uniref:Uncharacterized protein n=1 Tax=Periplaneta americana TaxID=6978 RepID=A0ABQ8SY82_PERAM|nr:hypothetical protein ANN_14564 [Periplaneta americana]